MVGVMKKHCCVTPCRATPCESFAGPLAQTAARLGSTLVAEVEEASLVLERLTGVKLPRATHGRRCTPSSNCRWSLTI